MAERKQSSTKKLDIGARLSKIAQHSQKSESESDSDDEPETNIEPKSVGKVKDTLVNKSVSQKVKKDTKSDSDNSDDNDNSDDSDKIEDSDNSDSDDVGSSFVESSSIISKDKNTANKTSSSYFGVDEDDNDLFTVKRRHLVSDDEDKGDDVKLGNSVSTTAFWNIKHDI